MCGILVWIKKTDHIDQSLFIKAINKLRHRGPDSQKVFFYNVNKNIIKDVDSYKLDNTKYFIAMGSTRYATYDAYSRKSDMPLYSFNEQSLISFNGDIYNYLDLKKDLIDKGIKFNTNVDTEVLVNGIQIYGKNFLKKINGDYSFCNIDFKKNEIYFSRDTYGTKPLFYFNDHDEIIIASEISSIINILGDRKNIDILYNFIPHFLSTNEWKYNNNSNLLIYDKIHSVEPGTFNTISLDSFSLNTNKELEIQNRLKSFESKYDYNHLENDFIDSINLRLQTDKKVAIFLSGGLDSSLITSLYIKKLKDKFEDVQIFTSENFHKDLPFVEKLSKELNFNYTELEIGYNENIFEYIDDIISTSYLPCPTYGNAIGMYAMFKKMSEYNRGIVITGAGGDQVFGGLSWTLHAAKEYFKKNNYYQVFNHIFRSNFFEQELSKTLIQLIMNNFNLSQFFSRKNLKKFPIHRRWAENDKIRTMFDQQIYDIKMGDFATSNNLIDFISMNNSIAIRSPFMDIRFLKAINSDITHKYKDGYDRIEIRKLLKKYESNIHKRKSKQGLRWNEEKMLEKNSNRIIDEIKSSIFYEKNSLIHKTVEDFENKKEIYNKHILMKYYSLSRFDKIVNSSKYN